MPSAFEIAQRIEARGREKLAPWLDRNAFNGRWIWNAKSRLALVLQKQVGDAAVAVSAFESLQIEAKFLENSRDFPYETWSNRVDRSDGTIDVANSTPGWPKTCGADLILKYNISDDHAILGLMSRLHTFANSVQPSGLSRMALYREVIQSKYQQPNRSFVKWIPHGDLVKHAGFIAFEIRQLELWERQQRPLKYVSAGA